MAVATTCPLCVSAAEDVLYSNHIFRIINVFDGFYPGYIRLILNQHVAEMTELEQPVAEMIFAAVLKVEQQVRRVLTPDKINLASLGNMVPHLHWHIIPRYTDDRHFPNPIWGEVTHPAYYPSAELVAKQQQLTVSLKNMF